MGLDFEVLDSGCCGLAGSFGFEREHDEISRQIGEHRLLPAVREAGEETLLIADGFSCKTQIEQLTERRALHTAQVIKMAMRARRRRREPARPAPEERLPRRRPERRGQTSRGSRSRRRPTCCRRRRRGPAGEPRPIAA